MPKGMKKTVVKDEDGGSVTPPQAKTKPTGWGHLPNELLTKIFHELKIEVDDDGKLKSEVERQALLNCRLMNRRWKDVVNDLLEKQCLKFWTEWRPHVSKQDATGSPHRFAVLHLVNTLTEARFGLAKIHCPPFLQMEMLEKSPSPTNSVCVTQKPIRWHWDQVPRSRNWTLTGVDVFAKFGQHLTAITFFDIHPMGILTFQRILSHIPNLQALTLQHIFMTVLKHDMCRIHLHPPPKLAHLKLLDTYWREGLDKRDFNSDLTLRILEAYKQRLETLEIDCWCDKIDLEGFPRLKQLKIILGLGFSSCKTLQLPSVSHLCLHKFPVCDMGLIKELPYLLHKSTTTLVHLHIQLDPNTGSGVEVNPLHDNWEFPTLPNVKSFAVTYPNCLKESEAVQRFLKMFPNLDELNFIQFYDISEYWEPTEDVKEALKNHLLEMSCLTHCKKLKVVSVSMNADSSKPFHTSRAPFLK